MTVSYRAAGTRQSSSGGTSLSTWTLPTRSAGDILIAVACSKNNATHSWSGTGWTKIGQRGSGASFTVSWAWKLSDGTDNTPTASWSGSVAAGGIIYSISGANSAGPGQPAYDSGTSSTHAGTDTTASRSGAVFYCEMAAANTALATPTNFTEHNDAGSATGATRQTLGSRARNAGEASGTASATGASAAWARLTFELSDTLAATLNPSDVAGGTPTFSDGNRAIVSGTDGTAMFARSTVGSSAPFYFECLRPSNTSIEYGVTNGTQALANAGSSEPNKGVSIYCGSDWAFYSDNIPAYSSFSSGTGATNDRICVAVDPVNGKLWARLNNGNWNNSGTDNPATNSGGLNISDFGSTLFAFAKASYTYTPATIYFASGDWSYSAPSGFSALTTVLSLTAAAGSFSLTGQAATLTYASGGGAYSLTASAGSFALTGVSASLLYGRSVTADAGSLALTGVAANLLYGRSVTADAGAFALTGNAASTLYGRSVTAGAGAFAVTGVAAGLLATRTLAADAGTFAVAGVDAGLSKGQRVTVDAGTFVVTGIDAGFRADRRLTASAGSIAVTGNDADLRPAGAGRTLAADPAAFAVTGAAAGLLYGQRGVSDAGTFVFTGVAAALVRGRSLVASAGAFTVTDISATLRRAYAVTADPGSILVTGSDADLVGPTWRDADAASGSWTAGSAASGSWTPRDPAGGSWS